MKIGGQRIAAIRGQMRRTQDQFAKTIGVPAGTVRNWEQNRRQPTGSARTLLLLIEADPDIMRGLLRKIAKASA